jgi:hypothetical protein
VIGLHPLAPVAFFVPFGTGFVTGWQFGASRREGILVGLIMGLWMMLLCAAVFLGFLTLIPSGLGRLEPGTALSSAAIILLLVGHLALFAGVGAITGGHLARRDGQRTAE